jgi:hypothetical protein
MNFNNLFKYIKKIIGLKVNNSEIELNKDMKHQDLIYTKSVEYKESPNEEPYVLIEKYLPYAINIKSSTIHNEDDFYFIDKECSLILVNYQHSVFKLIDPIFDAEAYVMLLAWLTLWGQIKKESLSDIAIQNLQNARTAWGAGIKTLINQNIPFMVTRQKLTKSCLFELSDSEGVVMVALNIGHPFYKAFIEHTDENQQNKFFKLLAGWGVAEKSSLSNNIRYSLEFSREVMGSFAFSTINDVY